MERSDSTGTVIRVKRPEYFDTDQIFDCGQTFRFNKTENGKWSGIALGRELVISEDDDTLTIEGIDREDFEGLFSHYLALDDDYSEIRRELLSLHPDDPILQKAMDEGKGIRILHQDPLEMIITSIITQNNNIPRIKKIVKAICEKYGTPIGTGYSFPSLDALSVATEGDFSELGAGFRAKYLVDCISKLKDGSVDPGKIPDMETEDAISYLETIKGIGTKVASCALLFGFSKYDAFPIDVWMNRINENYYQGKLDYSTLGRYAGIAQQYLFQYVRNHPHTEN